MRIVLQVNGETWSYESPEGFEEEGFDFTNPIIMFETLLRAAYPNWEDHALVAMCPDGNIHDPEDSQMTCQEYACPEGCKCDHCKAAKEAEEQGLSLDGDDKKDSKEDKEK